MQTWEVNSPHWRRALRKPRELLFAEAWAGNVRNYSPVCFEELRTCALALERIRRALTLENRKVDIRDSLIRAQLFETSRHRHKPGGVAVGSRAGPQLLARGSRGEQQSRDDDDDDDEDVSNLTSDPE